jgi:DNA gyrase subunit B
MLAHGVERPIPLKPEFLRSKDYAEMASMGETITSLIEEGGYFQRGEKTLRPGPLPRAGTG